jgi:hypothetical protein
VYKGPEGQPGLPCTAVLYTEKATFIMALKKASFSGRRGWLLLAHLLNSRRDSPLISRVIDIVSEK